jgi:hypothetical protein
VWESLAVHRLAVHRLLATATLLVLAGWPAVAEGGSRLTHRVTVSGSLTNEWTATPQQDCEPQGSGRLRFEFRTTRAVAVRPQIQFGGGPWGLLVPVPGTGFMTGVGPLPASGSVTRTDGTQPKPPTPPRPDDPCDPLVKSGCGTRVVRNVRVRISGVDRRRLSVDAGPIFPSGGRCLIGEFDGWDQPPAVAGGEFFVTMPSPATLAGRPTTVIRASSRRRFVTPDGTETVSRRVTVTFTRR